MKPEDEAGKSLRRLFRRRTVVDMHALFKALDTRSRMTVFRRLKKVGYLSSYTHTGRYYTLADIPVFDEWGLWSYRDAGFSRAGTLKQTVAAYVTESADGRTHGQLRDLLRVRVHNTLAGLVGQGRIDRQTLHGVHLYVSVDAAQAAQQMERRRQADRMLAKAMRVLTSEEIVEVLVETLRTAPDLPSPALVASRLQSRGLQIEPHHVQKVFDSQGLLPEKKTVRPNSSPSRR